MSKRVVQSVVVFAVAIVSYLLYSAAVKDDKAAPAGERAEQQENSAVAEEVEADVVPVVGKADDPSAAEPLVPTIPTFVATTPKAEPVQEPEVKKQEKEPQKVVGTTETVAEKAASVTVKSIDDSEKKKLQKGSPAKAVTVEESPPVAVDDKVEEAPRPASAVVIQAKVVKEAVKPVPKVEKAPVSAVVAPKTVIIQEPETVKQKTEPEKPAAVAEQEVEDVKADVVAVALIVVKEEETVATETSLEVKPDTSVEVVPAVETAVVLAATPEVEVADKTEKIQEEVSEEAEASIDDETVEQKADVLIQEKIIVDEAATVTSIDEAPVALAAVTVQAEVSKEVTEPVIEPETAAVEQEAEKDIAAVVPVAIKEEETVVTETPLEVEPDAVVEVVPVVEATEVLTPAPEAEVTDKIETTEQEKEPEAVAVATEPAAEKVSPAVVAQVIETEKVVNIEKDLPVAVEEKADTVIPEEKGEESEDVVSVDETPVALAAVEQEVEKDVAAVIPVAIKEEPDAAVEVVPVVETSAVLAETPEVEVADRTEEIKEEPEAAKVSMDEMTVEKKPDVVIPGETVDETPIALAAVTVQAEVSKEAAEPVLKVETVLASVAVTPKAVPVQESEPVEPEKEQTIVVPAVEPVVEKEVEAELVAVASIVVKKEEVITEPSLKVESDASVEDVPVVETVSASVVTAQEAAVVKAPGAVQQEKEEAVVAAAIEPAVEKAVSVEESLPVTVEEKTDTGILEESSGEAEDVVSVEKVPAALAAVVIQAEVSKEVAEPVLIAETVALSAVVTPKAVAVQEPKAVKHETKPEIAETAVEKEKKGLEAEVVAVMPVVVEVEEAAMAEPLAEMKSDSSVETDSVVETAVVLTVTPEEVAAEIEPAAEKMVTVEESSPVVKEEKVETQEKKEVVEEIEADVLPVVVKAEEAVITEVSSEVKAESSALASPAVVKEAVESEKPETIKEEKELKTVVAVIEEEPEKAAPVVVKPTNDSKQETPKPRTQEDEDKAKKTYKNYGSKAVVVTPEAGENEWLLHQHVGYFTRNRYGVNGLGRLQESKMLFTVGAESGQSTYGLTLHMVQLESGKLKIADYGLYGTDGAVAVETPAQSAGGMALSLNYRYEQKNFALSGMVGMTPSADNGISPAPLWDVAVEGNFDILKTYGRFVQRSVVDSLLSSVGNSDLYTQQVWGRIVKQGVEAGVRLGDEYKFALDLGYYPVIKGKNTLENSEITSTVSVVKPVGIPSIDRFDAGLLLAYDDYEFDSEHYTYGHGGYFSPQSYIRGGVLFDMTQQFSDSILFDARASVGYTSYKNEEVEKYPFETGAETYAAESSKFISAETAVFLGMALGDSAQVMTGAGYSNHTDTNEFFLSIALHIYLQEHRMSRRDFVSIDRFANTSR